MTRILIASVLALVSCATGGAPSEQASGSTAPVVAAERVFAARAGEIGWIPAFCEYSSADSHLVGQNGLENAHERMCALPDDGERNLFWDPSFAGIARSGDFGFTTGPASFDAERTPRIQYFTVWRVEPDGSWKWIYDGGPGPVGEPGPYLAAGAAPESLPIAQRGAGSAAEAVQQVSDIETGATNAAALAAHLAEGAHVYRSAQPRAFGGAASTAAMSYPTSDVAYRLVRVESSAAGDVVFTLGEASWQRDGQTRRGYFARMWQLQPGGWRIVYDQLVGGAAPAPQ